MNFYKKHKFKIHYLILITIIMLTSGYLLQHIYVDSKQLVHKTEIVANKSEIKKSNIFEGLGVDFWGVLTTAVLGFVGISINHVQKSRFGKVELQLERNNIEHQDIIKINLANYNVIVSELGTLKDMTARKLVIDSFRSIISSYTRMSSDTELKPFIDAEGERLITFAEEIMNEHFTKLVLEQAIVKIDYALEELLDESKHLFGINFATAFKVIQQKNVSSLKESIHNIASDELLNHKYERFRSVCEHFLHTHLIDIIKLHLTLKIK